MFDKLSNLCSYENGKGHEKFVLTEGKFVLINSKFISTEGQVIKKVSKQLTPIYKGDIAIVLSDLPNGKALAKCFFIEENNKYTVNQRIARLSIKNKKLINSKFLYYYLNRNHQLLKYDDKTNQTNLRKGQIEDVLIPIPQIEVQNEIVEVLDKFTELETELETKLEARTKQYEYYRNKLLDFSTGSVGVPRIDKMLAEMCPNGVERNVISKIFTLKNGYTPSKAKKEYWENGSIPWFRMEDLRTNGNILSDSIQHVTPSAIKGNLFPANSIIISTSATIGEHALVLVEHMSNQRFTNLTPNSSYKDRINMKYMNYYMFIVSEWCKSNTNVSGFASVDMNGFRNLEIPIPPIEVQNEIVKIL